MANNIVRQCVQKLEKVKHNRQRVNICFVRSIIALFVAVFSFPHPFSYIITISRFLLTFPLTFTQCSLLDVGTNVVSLFPDNFASDSFYPHLPYHVV